MSSLSEKLALLTTTPVFKDVEDDDDPTFAKLTEKRDDDEDFVDVAKTGSSKLRRQTADLLASDARYAGKKVSRNKLQDEDDYGDEEDLEDDLDSDSDSEADDDSEDADSGKSDEGDDEFRHEKAKQTSPRIKPEKEFTFGEDFSRYADDDVEEDSSFEDSQDEDSEEEEEEDVVESTEDEDAVQSFSKTNLDEEVAKGEAAKAQLGVWDRLLEQRIKLQGMLGIVNQMPRPEMWEEFQLESGEEYHESLKAGQRSLRRLMDDLLELQTLLLHQNPETKYVVNETDTKKSDADEEVTSDEEESMLKEPAKDLPKIQRKRKLEDYSELLEKRHCNFQQYRNNTIQKWYDKTSVASGKIGKGFGAFEQSALKQIEQILGEKERLIKRTQLKRSVYRVLGSQEDTQPMQQDPADDDSTTLPSRDHLKQTDEEVFDDSDFYHQTLRQLIERKTADINDPVALSRHWLAIQRLRNKVKKNVDKRASKGRKVRYDVHRKLLNFMAPVDHTTWTDDQRDELYSSVFGARHRAQDTESKDQTEKTETSLSPTLQDAPTAT